MERRSDLKIILHNVLTWTSDRGNEYTNYYNREQPDIILINEVGNNKKVKIFNYNIHEKNHLNEWHAGVAIAVRKDVRYQLLDDFADDILGVKLQTSKGPINIITHYSPPRRDYLPLGELNQKLQSNEPVYLLGDLNARHPMFGYNRSNMKGREIKRLIDRNIITHFGPEFPTFIGSNTKPDVVLGNRHAFYNIAILPGELTTSDHLPVVVKLSTKPIVKDVQSKFYFKNADWDKFKVTVEREINSETTEEPLEGGGINQEKIDKAIINWINILKQATVESVPKKALSFFIHPHESDYIKLLEQNYKQLLDLNHWDRNTLNLIRNIQGQIREESKRLVTEMWNNKIQKVNSLYKDPAQFWNNIKGLMGGNSTKNLFILNQNNAKLYEPRDKEREFRNIWSNVFKISDEENQNFDLNHERMVTDYLDNHQQETQPFPFADLTRLDPDNFMTRPVTRYDIISTIKEFKNNKAPGESGINKLILIQLPISAIDRLKDIINLSVSMGYFSIVLKNGIIVLIPKPGKDSKIPINYRPITLLEIPGKIIERIINKRLHRFCERNNIFHKDQYGFRAGKGTDIAIAKVNEIIGINQKYKDHMNIVCRDVQKAFDKVWTQGLKYKIINIPDLPDIIQKMLCSYVSNRTAQIRIETFVGDKINLESGVPQGGILSPTLYILYTRDIPPPAGENNLDVIFADDVTQIIQNLRDDRRALAEATRVEIERINEYEKKWKIQTSINKFSLLSISKSSPEPVVVNNRQIPFKNEVKMLGLTIKRTGVRTHCNTRLGLAKVQSKKIKRFIKLDPKIKLHLYKALIRPILEYPIIPNGIQAQTNILQMQRVQNANLKFVSAYSDQRNMTIEELHSHYDIEPLNTRYYDAVDKLWSKMELKENEIHRKSTEENNNIFADHYWWKRAALYLERPRPNPIYT